MLLENDIVVDLAAAAGALGVNLEAAFADLRALLAAADARLAARTADLALPCRRGCDMCCHQSVLLTPLEFMHAWDHLQRHTSRRELVGVVARGLALFAAHQGTISALDRPPPAGAPDHTEVVRGLNYRCPLLGDDGACRVYPAREMAARLFGGSFQAPGELYACHLVGAHLAGRRLTLPNAISELRALRRLPLTGYRQVYPYFIDLFYRSSAEPPT